VAFVLAVLSTGHVLLRGPKVKSLQERTRIFGATTRRQLRVQWGPRATVQLLTNAIGEDDGEVRATHHHGHVLVCFLMA
jgi:hypothetical protein